MTRPIKFRAWDKNRQEYVYEWKDGSAISAWFWQKHSDEEARFVFEQVTGLTDKNGKEIYEGDIVRIPKSAHVFADMMTEADHEDLEKENGKFCIIEWEGTGFTGVGLAYVEQGEVIGNKCENPELLEAK